MLLLRGMIRSVARQWRVAAGVFAGVFLLGLLFGPRSCTYSARARLVPVPGGWSAARVLDFALGPQVSEEAARALGNADSSLLRSGLSGRIDRDAAVLEFSSAGASSAVERVNAVGAAAESLSAATRRAEADAAIKRVDENLAARRLELERLLSLRETPADRTARRRLDTLEGEVEAEREEIASSAVRIDLLGRLIDRADAGPTRPVNTAESDRLASDIELARRRLEALRAIYPEDWPPVVKAASQVADLQTRRAIAVNREILEARFAPVREAIEELRAVSARRDRLLQALPAREVEIRALRARTAKPAGEPTEAELHGRQEATEASIRDMEAARARLMAERGSGRAVERFEAAGAARLVRFLLPIVFGIAVLAGLLAAWIVEAASPALRTEHDVRRYVNLPLMALIPYSKSPADRLLPAAGPGVTEAFNILAALLETQTKTSEARLFAVTSSVPSEGKSTVACNAAVALARAGSRVLLVDADLRRGTQHRLFSVPNDVGLSAYLQGGTDTVDSMISATDVENLTLLPAGAPMLNPIPFLHSERFNALLRDLRGWYEYVILDLPPVKSAADPLIVAPLADSMLLVTAAGETRKDDVTYSKRMIRSVNGKLCGCVMTKARLRSGGYYYYPSGSGADEAA